MLTCLRVWSPAARTSFPTNAFLLKTVCDKVLELAQVERCHVVWEFFAGSGLFSVLLADRARKVSGCPMSRQCSIFYLVSLHCHGEDERDRELACRGANCTELVSASLVVVGTSTKMGVIRLHNTLNRFFCFGLAHPAAEVAAACF